MLKLVHSFRVRKTHLGTSEWGLTRRAWRWRYNSLLFCILQTTMLESLVRGLCKQVNVRCWVIQKVYPSWGPAGVPCVKVTWTIMEKDREQMTTKSKRHQFQLRENNYKIWLIQKPFEGLSSPKAGWTKAGRSFCGRKMRSWYSS